MTNNNDGLGFIILIAVVCFIIFLFNYKEKEDIYKDPDFSVLLKICDECIEEHKFAMPNFSWLLAIYTVIIVIVVGLPLAIFVIQNSSLEFSYFDHIDIAKLDKFVSNRPIQILLYSLPVCFAVMYGISISARKSAHAELMKLHLFKLDIVRIYLVSKSAIAKTDEEIRAALLQGAFDVQEKSTPNSNNTKKEVETNIPSIDFAIRLAAKMSHINKGESSTKVETTTIHGTDNTASSVAARDK